MSTPMDDGAQARGRTGRRRLAVGAAVVTLALAAVSVVWSVSGDGEPSAAAAPATTTVTTDAPPGTPAPAPPAPTGAAPPSGTPSAEGPVAADQLPPSLAPVALDGTAEAADGTRVTVERLEAVDGTALAPGDVGGPALRVTVRLENGSRGAVDLDDVVVRLTSGAELTPAPPLGDPSAAPLTGTAAPGETVEGVYVFSIAEDVRDLVTVSVGYRVGAPFLVFAGPAG
ncbi:hypothetical protein [Geodermatophilus sp. DSM 45219]|uniref:hypothetical protein n=1 Tax=Geodermatophilus sp. DSM 45219 TaxID=1881103 RepID=UPI0008905DCA|nr:hypothetical protein [Geodermatophilus sp. DSM 45219]SDN45420.1 hypothetical protein SAMN05428965_0461 [Geodermatophilus sp. DSM 45219]